MYELFEILFIINSKITNNCNIIYQILQEIVRENVDFYLDEYAEKMQVQTGKHVSVPTLWRSLAYCGITRKKVQILQF